MPGQALSQVCILRIRGGEQPGFFISSSKVSELPAILPKIRAVAFSFRLDTASWTGSGLIAVLLVSIDQSLSQSRETKYALPLKPAIGWPNSIIDRTVAPYSEKRRL